ncbi:hypothetical protein [Holdemania sp. 1001302B_160321_E10]|uniref:hypothetical protein n=1 Tax=Holdemania sp. 1001302B_160321_E10 TaxID=2787120 RepID=UPI00189B76EF|nr:hypothetical protein [Holdemania sp. 1001302B_160321_E10]
MNLLEWITKKYNRIISDLNRDILDSEKMKARFANDDGVNIYPIVAYIFNKDNNLSEMADRSFTNPEEIDFCLKKYQEIMYMLNKEINFVPTKENFCQFMGWTAEVYNQNLNSDADDIRAVMQMVEDYLIDSQLSAGQGGVTKANLTKFRTQVSGNNGHSLVTQKEANEDNRFKARFKPADQLERELKNLLPQALCGKKS